MPLIDANIFLEIELGQKRLEACRSYLKRVMTGEISAFTTDFIIDTISILMDNFECDPTQIGRFHRSLLKYKGLSIYDLTMRDRIVATEHMKRLDLDFDDAVAYTTMMSTGTKEIVSLDRHFDKIPDIKRIEP
jgi:predicted nucleic acid-binding protein